jgi:hypothetical protein
MTPNAVFPASAAAAIPGTGVSADVGGGLMRASIGLPSLEVGLR